MTLGDLRSAYRWPWDHAGTKYGAANDDDWVLHGGVWTHRTDLASNAAYWRARGWGTLE